MSGTEVDSRAVVDPSAVLGREVSVGPYCVIGPDVTIGDGCRLEAHTIVRGPTTIGPANVIGPMASIGGAPQDRKYKGENSRLEIGARNRIHEYVTMNRGTVGGGGVTRIGDDNLFMAYVHVAHDCQIANGTIFGNAATLGGHVEVGDSAIISAFSGVHQFCRVARHAFIGGYSVVTKDALPWVLTVGNRATSHGLNTVGLKRLGYSKETFDGIKRCYQLLFRSKKRLADALIEAEAEVGQIDEVRYFIDFVRSAERGVCR